LAADDDIILVDAEDNPIGHCPKLDAHENGGRLHRAFSIFIFNSRGELLLQRRAPGKYHFGGLWTNTCCSHPRRGQTTIDAARTRLREEFGFDAGLREVFCFTYRATDDTTGLTEHEFDHVLVGNFDGNPNPDPAEIGEWKWISPEALRADVREHPERYTPWFRISIDRVLDRI
jgi:isopentenyl-diphosphate delta-isomerase